MPKITIDDVEYNTEDLTENGKAQLASLQFLEGQMQNIRNEIEVYKTAQQGYIAALKSEIKNSGLQPVSNATPDERRLIQDAKVASR